LSETAQKYRMRETGERGGERDERDEGERDGGRESLELPQERQSIDRQRVGGQGKGGKESNNPKE
jgi:hypothetical protein